MEHAKEILTKAEAYYDNVTEELGITRFEGFWTWDARVKIYMYDDKASYTTQTKRASWSGGHVNVITHEIHAYINMDDFLDVILPHEIGHIVFREFIGFRRSLPLWVDEGVVSFLEKSQKADRMLLVKTVLEKTTYFVPLRELGTAVVGLGIMPDLFYAEAASVIEFLINRYGKEKFTELCQRIRDMREGQDWFLAFKETYGFRDIDEMNEKWVEFLRS
jgi:hypothetical protein